MSGQILRLKETPSTNNYTSEMVRQSVIQDWTIVVSDYQSKGRGQRLKHWHSERELNLLCSFYRKLNLPIQKQFQISMTVANAVCALLEEEGMEPCIKWPNDIMVNRQKAAGLLIENQVSNARIDHSIIGIGLNVNQREFPSFPWPATSMSLETSQVYDLDSLLVKLRIKLFESFQLPEAKARQAYNARLFGRGRIAEIESLGVCFRALLLGVSNEGGLTVEVEDRGKREQRNLNNASIKWIESVSRGSDQGHSENW